MSFDEYQISAGEYARYPQNVALLYTALGLAGEAGEYAGKVSKIIRDHDGVMPVEMREALISELGDILWFISEAAIALNCPLSHVASYNLGKLGSRATRGKLGGSGDDR